MKPLLVLLLSGLILAFIGLCSSQEISKQTTSKPDYDDDDDYEDDYDETTEKVQPSTTKPRKAMKVCVVLSPAHASTRNGPYVSYECLARLCSDDDDQSDGAKDIEQYKFRRPIFDWNSQFAHLLLANGTCDSSALNCWHKIEVNVDRLSDALEDEGIDRLEIKCTVADYVNSYDVYNYVFGEATSVLRFFRGNRPHEPCNATEDCGDNLMCSPSIGRDSALSDDEPSTGYCECPAQKLVSLESDSMQTGDQVTTATMRTMILVEDPHYLEQMCVPVRLYNESCLYKEQCRAVDPNTECRALLTSEGVESSSLVCDCAEGFKWSPAAAPGPRCMRSTAPSFGPSEVEFDDDDDDEDDDEQNSTEASLDQIDDDSTSPPVHDHDVYIWWIFPPEESAVSASTRSSSQHGVLYYGARVFNLSNLAYLLMLVAVLMPLLIILLTLIFYCHRKWSQSRQFSPRRTSFGADSIFYPEDNIPSTPSEKTKSVTFDFTHAGSPSTSPTSPNSGTSLFGKRSKSSDDKLDLVDNDQLEQMHKFP